ncbi:ATP-binding cassette domain-containing protein [Erysipelothrix urinaevulpis]|uniref:ATP-binding cassette domain-containing protein n=1 Tax=Erysipelothrix urinaevulpis TaxID=2683717 RepID=UPI001359A4B9|nr:ATP-binding cassette domain-containing protein [Erysipelothrix urinaevulpis]
MFNIKNLNISRNNQSLSLVKNFSFTFADQDKVALVGEEGTGKSSLIKAMVFKDSLDYASVKFDEMSDSLVVGYVPQLLSYQGSVDDMFYKNVDWEFFDYALFNELLNDFGLVDLDIDKRPYEVLSGGEKVKLKIIQELMKQPDILLLDEPTNDLDMKSIEALEKHLKAVNYPVVISSHDRSFIENVANTIIHFEQVKRRTESYQTIYRMTYSDFIEERHYRMTKQASQHTKETEEFDKAMERFESIHDRVHHSLKTATRQDPQAAKNLKDKMRTVKSMEKRLQRQQDTITSRPEFDKPIDFQLNNKGSIHTTRKVLDISIKPLKIKDKVLSKGVELQLYGPEKIAIIGENGIDKSTLLYAIKESLESSGLNVAWMPQSYSEVMDVKKNSIEQLADIKDKEAVTKARTFLGSLNFTAEEMLVPFSELSGGQKAKLYFGKMALDSSDVLLLDEPSRNISPLSLESLETALKNYTGAVIMVSHDRQLIAHVADKIYELDVEGLHLKETLNDNEKKSTFILTDN